MPVLLIPDENADASVPSVVGGYSVLVRRGDEAHELIHQDPDKKIMKDNRTILLTNL